MILKMIEKVGCGLSLLNASRHYSGGGTPESDLWIRRFLVMLCYALRNGCVMLLVFVAGNSGSP